MARILVAEDDSVVRQFVHRALDHAGHRATTAGDGLEALRILRRGEFDLLISDIVMPGLDGIALALAAAKEHPDMAIMRMTGFVREAQRAHNLEALSHRVIAKPFTLSEFMAAVESVLSARRPAAED